MTTATAIRPLTADEVETAKEYLRERSRAFAERIAPVYRVLGWTWGDAERAYVPKVHHIEASLHEIIADLKPWECAPHIARVETGGLFASVEREPAVAGGGLRVEIGFEDAASAWWD